MQLQYETPRLILKILKGDNANANAVLDFYLRDRELFEQYEPDRVPNYYTVSFHKAVLRSEYNLALSNQHIRYHVFLKENPGRIIGTVCLHQIQENFYSRCELGYKFSSSVHHNGYAKEALSHLLFAAFDELKIHRVNAWVQVGNTPSIRLLEKLGFEQEGICKDYIKLNNVWYDHIQYSFLNPF